MRNRIDPFWGLKIFGCIALRELGPPTKQLRKLLCSITLADDVQDHDHDLGDIVDGDDDGALLYHSCG